MRSRPVLIVLAAAVASLVVQLVGVGDAHAIPAFARKYKASCQTCHTVYPMLNAFGEAFRRNGYRFPSQDGSRDSDNIKEEMLPLGQPEHRDIFPDQVLPDSIPQSVPLAVMVNGTLSYNFSGSDAYAGAGHAFSFTGIPAEFHLFSGGAFTDTITHFAQLTINTQGQVDLETGYLLLNDIVGPDHLFNVWVGRLMAPQLTSFGLHSSYLSDTNLPGVSIANLYNPTGSFTLGMGHTDGVEANGVFMHRFGYSVGWVASGSAAGLSAPTSEDVYAHVGFKLGGMSLDGEGESGMQTADSKQPWAETAVTLDAFAYHGLSVLDNGTGVTPGAGTPQNDAVDAIGGAVRGQVGSLLVNAGARYEHHASPYQGSAATPAAPPNPAVPGAPDSTPGKALVEYGEVDYVVYPWLVPGVRAEYTRLTLRETVDGAGYAYLVRVIPGVAMAVRPNIRLIVTGDLEFARGVPALNATGANGSWAAAGGAIAPPQGTKSALEAEQINATLAWSF